MLVTTLVVAALAALSADAFGPRCSSAKTMATGKLNKAQLAPPANLKMAFLGDQGLGSDSVAVLNLVKSEGAEMVIHAGDFDYESDPESWMEQLESVLGDDFPYFASIGNHDLLRWDAYAEVLSAHQTRANLTCVGEIGVQSTCTYKGLLIVISGVGTKQGEIEHDAYITQQLSAQENIWKIVAWHKNHRQYQIGGKVTEVGIENYDAALAQGAILATGHEHSYARTHLMSSFSDFVVVNENNTLNIEPGKSFVFCSGLGGESIRDWNDELIANPHWAAYAASDNGVGDGALFCTYNIDNNPKLAECYFKDVNGAEYDRFKILSNNEGVKTKQHMAAQKRLLSTPREIVEVSIAKPEDDFSADAAGKKIQGQHLLLGSGYTTTLHFSEFSVTRANLKQLNALHLQLYGASNGELPSFEIRAVKADGEVTKHAVVWDKEDDGFVNESVWVSPDIKSLVAEVVASSGHKDTHVFGLTLVITGKGFRKVWSTDMSDCLAPTLSSILKI